MNLKATSILLLLSLTCGYVLTFSLTKLSTVKRSTISMAGKNLAEVGLSKKQIFQQFKGKLNKAAEEPGFFDVGAKAEIELYCKSNRDGTQIGDCPFAQFVQLVLLKKGLLYNIHPTLPEKKPEWLLEKHQGKLPTLVHKSISLSDSLAIAEYLERNFPQKSLTRQGAFSYQEVLEKTAGFFPALSTLIKNKDPAQDVPLLAAVEAQLDLLDELIRSTPGQYICGLELTLADLYLVPQLFHAMVTLDHFKGVEFYHLEGDPTRPALENYCERMFAMKEFNDKRAYYNVDQVIYGWKVARAAV